MKSFDADVESKGDESLRQDGGKRLSANQSGREKEEEEETEVEEEKPLPRRGKGIKV